MGIEIDKYRLTVLCTVQCRTDVKVPKLNMHHIGCPYRIAALLVALLHISDLRCSVRSLIRVP
jgi:hypothetical protein